MMRLLTLTAIVSGAQAFISSRSHLVHSRCSSVLSAEASFGMGCFWKPSEELLKVPGVIDTVVGYTGNAKAEKPPTYDKVCYSRDWVEGVRVIYDENQISYEQLLDAFFEAQEPGLGSRQYASIIFSHDQEQKQIAKEWLQKNQSKVRKDGLPAKLTEIEPLTPFYQAENYHQRYWQKTRPRIVGMVALLAVSTGILDNITPEAIQGTVHSAANAIVLAGSGYVLLERFIDTKVVKL